MKLSRVVALVCGIAALGVVPTASADPVPGIGQAWPRCGVLPDDDGRYCIISMTRNGVEVARPVAGPWFEPYVDLIGAGDVRFGVIDHDGPFTLDPNPNLDPADRYVVRFNSGPIVPRELYGQAGNILFERGGDAVTGYSVTLGFNPVPAAFRLLDPVCCGPDSLADTVYSGFVTGFVTDNASLVPSVPDERVLRTGFWTATGAQRVRQPLYDPISNTLIINLENPHFRTPGVVATSSYSAFIPNRMLLDVLRVPDPANLNDGSMVVTRSDGGVVSATPFTLERLATGVLINIPTITFSSPVIRIRPKPRPPGVTRITTARRVGVTSARIGFAPPRANGGSRIRRYVARCTAPGRVARVASGAASPLLVRNLAIGVAYRCTIRATNAVGAGPRSIALRVPARP